MKRTLLFAVLAAGLLTASPSDLRAQKKGTPVAATLQHYTLLAGYKEMVGVIQNVNTEGIILRVEYTHPPTEPVAVQKVAQQQIRTNNQLLGLQNRVIELQRDQFQLSRAKNPVAYNNKLREIAHDIMSIQNQIYRIQVTQARFTQNNALAAANPGGRPGAVEYLEFDIPYAPKATVRKLAAGVMFDDKGMPIQPAAPAKDGQPGQPADIKELSAGMDVKVYLAPGKTGSVKAGELPPANRPQARQIVILEGAPAKGKK